MPSLPQSRPEIIEFLSKRRSNLVKLMKSPGPDESELDTILKIGARVPDHRKLAPWRFIVIDGAARGRLGDNLAEIFEMKNPKLPKDRVEFERERFKRAPLVIAVISSPVDCPRGTPKWEQELSAGAVCFNLCLAAQSLGYGAQWLTEWYAFDADFSKKIGLESSERIAGYIYVGTVTDPPTERPRPEVKAITKRLS